MTDQEAIAAPPETVELAVHVELRVPIGEILDDEDFDDDGRIIGAAEEVDAKITAAVQDGWDAFVCHAIDLPDVEVFEIA